MKDSVHYMDELYDLAQLLKKGQDVRKRIEAHLRGERKRLAFVTLYTVLFEESDTDAFRVPEEQWLDTLLSYVSLFYYHQRKECKTTNNNIEGKGITGITMNGGFSKLSGSDW